MDYTTCCPNPDGGTTCREVSEFFGGYYLIDGAIDFQDGKSVGKSVTLAISDPNWGGSLTFTLDEKLPPLPK